MSTDASKPSLHNNRICSKREEHFIPANAQKHAGEIAGIFYVLLFMRWQAIQRNALIHQGSRPFVNCMYS